MMTQDNSGHLTPKKLLAALSVIAAAYGYIGSIIPALSGGTVTSIAFIVLGTFGIVWALLIIARNPIKKVHTLDGADQPEPVYSKGTVTTSRWGIALILLIG